MGVGGAGCSVRWVDLEAGAPKGHLLSLLCPPALFKRGVTALGSEWCSPTQQTAQTRAGFLGTVKDLASAFSWGSFALFELQCTVTAGRSLAQGAAASHPPSAEDARAGHWDAVPRELPFLWDTELGTCVHPASSLQWEGHL